VPSFKHTLVPDNPGLHSQVRDCPGGEHSCEASELSEEFESLSPQPIRTNAEKSCVTTREVRIAQARNGRFVVCM
jgi:hypothetical protein